MARKFDMQELAFFACPRRWIPIIVERFGDDSDVRDAIIHSDEDGGLGFLRWKAAAGTWELTEKGKRWVGNRRMMKELREWPDTRVSGAEEPPAPPPPPEEPNRTFLCPVCETKSLGADRCMSCEPPPPENP